MEVGEKEQGIVENMMKIFLLLIKKPMSILKIKKLDDK